jgi:hypothetical protein
MVIALLDCARFAVPSLTTNICAAAVLTSRRNY